MYVHLPLLFQVHSVLLDPNSALPLPSRIQPRDSDPVYIFIASYRNLSVNKLIF